MLAQWESRAVVQCREAGHPAQMYQIYLTKDVKFVTPMEAKWQHSNVEIKRLEPMANETGGTNAASPLMVNLSAPQMGARGLCVCVVYECAHSYARMQVCMFCRVFMYACAHVCPYVHMFVCGCMHVCNMSIWY